jgi:PAS domain S-box-containing protein
MDESVEQRFFDLSLDMLCVLRFDGYFARLNPAWETTLGFTREELMARRFIEFVHPDDRDRTLGQSKDVRGGAQARLFENRYLCKDGSYRWLLWNARPDVEQQVIYGVARDITELKAALDEVRTLRSFLPICSYCKNIRDDDDYWHSLEDYIHKHTNTRFSHGVCPSCLKAVLNDLPPEQV